MRVLVVSNMFPTLAEPWFGSFVRDQVNDLAALGIEVDVLAFDGREDWAAYLRAARQLRARVKRNRYTLVHAHYGLTGAAAALARPPAPLVTTFHGSDYCGPTWQRLVSLLAARRSKSIVVNEEGRARLFVPDAWVIPMGVDTDTFAPRDRVEARRALGWADDARYALLAGGRNNPVKGADLFDAAVELVRGNMPELIGVALEGYDREGVALALNASDVTVVASEREGSPLTVRESLACMTPVVSVPVGDVPAVLADLPGCAVVSRDAAALAEGMRCALAGERDPSLRERAELSSRTVIAERVRDVYLTIAPEAR